MDIIVSLKRVPDAGAHIEIGGDGLGIKTEGPWILNPYDEFALEEAIRIKERFGGRITLVNAGDEGGEEALKKGIAMGADSAIYIKDPLLKDPGPIGTARALSSAIAGIPFDIILCGRVATDSDSGAVGPAISAFLNIPVISSVKKLDIVPETKRAIATRETGAGIEIIECVLPALFTAHKGLNEPRFPSLSGIMRAKKEAVKYLDLRALGVTPEEVLKTGLKREGLSYPLFSRKAVILKGDVKEQVKEALRFLKDEVKVI